MSDDRRPTTDELCVFSRDRTMMEDGGELQLKNVLASFTTSVYEDGTNIAASANFRNRDDECLTVIDELITQSKLEFSASHLAITYI